MSNYFLSYRIEMKSGDAKFVGAWWIGFLMSGMIALTISLPMCGFPRELPGKQFKQPIFVSHVRFKLREMENSMNIPVGWDCLENMMTASL